MNRNEKNLALNSLICVLIAVDFLILAVAELLDKDGATGGDIALAALFTILAIANAFAGYLPFHIGELKVRGGGQR